MTLSAQPRPVRPDPSASPKLFLEADFRRLWLTGLIAFFVRWMEILVFGVFTYQQTGSAFLVASMIMLRLVPLAVLGVPFGALAARLSRRVGLIVSMAVLSATALALFFIAWLGQLAVWHLAVGSVINGIAWAGDSPLRRGLIGDVAGPLRMGNAMALDVGASNASRLAGPAVGGLLLAHVGMSALFLLCAVLQLVALAAVLRIQHRETPREASITGLKATLAAGFLAARDSPRLAGALWITVLFNIFAWPVLSMVPVIGKDRLGLGADGIGLLASMDGLGSLFGALLLAVLSRPALYGPLYVGGVILFLSVLPVLALSTHVPLSGGALLLLGMGQSAFAVMQSTIVYVAAPPDRRPQAMGLLTMCIGTGPIGFLLLGWLAEHQGASVAAVISAVAGLLVLALSWRWWRPCWRNESPPGA